MSEHWTDDDDWAETSPFSKAESAAEPHAEQEAPAKLVYGSTDEFVREYLRHVYRRRIDGKTRVWAGRWWQYDEAVIRLESLWRAWEHFRQDAHTGMAVWWRDFADYHMGVLFDPFGPFYDLDADDAANHNRRGDPLPYEPPPEGMFLDER